jgi:hypothetical protein
LNKHKLIQKIEKSELKNIIQEYFDFEIIEPNSNTKEYFFKMNEKVIVIAKDASGGIFVLVDEELKNKPIIYISSDGEAGKVGENFEEFFALMITCPNWQDLLKFSGNGQVSEMIKAYSFLKNETLEDYPEIETITDKIISELSINKISNPVETLYKSMVSDPQFSVFSLEGDEFDSLFNSFVVTDNPLWKNKIQ